jgi:hypothetical protein
MKHTCMMCGQVEVAGKWDSCAPCQQELDDDMSTAMDEQSKIERSEALQFGLQQRCKVFGGWKLTRIQRWLYTAKALICLLLNSRDSLWSEDSIEVAYWNYHGGYNASWQEFHVGQGIFKNWVYDVYSNGD